MTGARGIAIVVAAGCHPAEEPVERLQPPSVDSVRIEAGASGLRDLRCVADVIGECTLQYLWHTAGPMGDRPGELVPAAAVAPGSEWSCTATAENAAGSDTAVSPPYTAPTPAGGNVLIIVLDDVGTDKLSTYHMGVPTPPTPTLDALAASSVQFQNVYVTPACSTSRSVLLSGRYGRRTGMVQSISDGQVAFALDPREVLLPEMLSDNRGGFSYTSVALGKWHLMSVTEFEPGSVEAEGFDWFQGTKSNLTPWDYFSWQQVWSDQSTSIRDGYVTSAVADDTLAALRVLPEPWLAWVALHAAHIPVHVPPADLQDRGVTSASTEGELYDAMLQAADTELGQLLAGMDPELLARTTLFVLGDNGTPDFATVPPLDPERAKLTVFEGGVRVPLLVSGPLVNTPGRVSEALVSGADIFATIADIVGVPLSGTGDTLSVVRADTSAVPIDGVSFLPLMSDPTAEGERTFLFSEQATGNGPPPWTNVETTVRNEGWKIIQSDAGLSLYALDEGLDDGEDLLQLDTPLEPAALDAVEALQAELDRVHANTPYAW